MEKISVIVPVYNGEKYLEKCIESIEKQTWSKTEILLVNDGSTDRTEVVAKRLKTLYPNIVLLKHQTNRGLFSARITGVEASTGDYIAFVDADDSISCDWLRLLHNKMTETGADIVAGPVLQDIDGKSYGYNNLDPLRQPVELSGDQPIDFFMRQQGTYFSWWLVWNKLYTRKLWRDALPDLKEFDAAHPRFVMCEDQAFSVALWIRAKKVCNVTHGACYFYFRHEGASTAASADKPSYEKKIVDVAASITFIKQQLERFGLNDRYAENLRAWKETYAAMYYDMGSAFGKNYRLQTISALLETNAAEVVDKGMNTYFHSIYTKMKSSNFFMMEEMRRSICDPKIQVVSFDVFDTLVLRPFYAPKDLFRFLSDDFNRLAQNISYVSFEQLRVHAEKHCRDRLCADRCGNEEITLDEIYTCLTKEYGLDNTIAEQMKALEIEAEKRFCYARRTAKELYALAKHLGKKVIAVSDMYLPEKTVTEILANCGYAMDEVFVSSAHRTAKRSGNLYKYATKKFGLPKGAFFHIGDNYESDVVQAKKAGWTAAYLPKCTDVFENRIPSLYGGTAVNGFILGGGVHDTRAAEEWLGWRCAMALAANKLFDDPFGDIHPETDFNADPYRIGYFALGPYLYAVTDWLLKKAAQKEAKILHFAARDGYIPLRAAQLFAEYGKTVPKTDYVFLSRKAMALADIGSAVDLRSLSRKLNPRKQSAKKLCALFRPFLKDRFDGANDAELCRYLQQTESVYVKNFLSQEEFDGFLSKLAKMIDFVKLQTYREKLGAYFKSIFNPGDLLFDIGYSGRSESALRGLLGFPVNSLYLHTNGDIADCRERFFGFTADTFYNFKPTITGVVREHVFMKLAPSAVGYEEKDNVMQPVFEEYSYDFATEWMTRAVQNAALDFVRDMLRFFGNHDLPYQRDDLAFPFEYYLRYSKELDRKIFSCVSFEDILGEGKKLNAFEYWQNELTWLDRQRVHLQAGNSQNLSKIRKFANKLLPVGTRRREFVKKLYWKLLG